MVDVVITRIRFSGGKFGKCKQVFSPVAESGTSKISLVPETRRKPDSNIRQNQTFWEPGFVWPGTPAGTKGLMTHIHMESSV